MSERKELPAYNGTVKAINEHKTRKNDPYKVVLLGLNGKGGTIPVYLSGKPLTQFEEAGFKAGDSIRILGTFDIDRQDGTIYQLSYTMSTQDHGDLRVVAMKGIWVGKPLPPKNAGKDASEQVGVQASGNQGAEQNEADDLPF